MLKSVLFRMFKVLLMNIRIVMFTLYTSLKTFLPPYGIIKRKAVNKTVTRRNGKIKRFVRLRYRGLRIIYLRIKKKIKSQRLLVKPLRMHHQARGQPLFSKKFIHKVLQDRENEKIRIKERKLAT